MTKDSFLDFLRKSAVPAAGKEEAADKEAGKVRTANRNVESPLASAHSPSLPCVWRAAAHAQQGAAWSVLSDDYLLGARMKDWGKAAADEEEEEEREMDVDVLAEGEEEDDA